MASLPSIRTEKQYMDKVTGKLFPTYSAYCYYMHSTRRHPEPEYNCEYIVPLPVDMYYVDESKYLKGNNEWVWLDQGDWGAANTTVKKKTTKLPKNKLLLLTKGL